MKQLEFNNLVKELEKNGYHVLYSLENGICWVSYKSERAKLTVGMTHQQFQDKLYWMQPVFKNIQPI